jgi:sporulation protein YlmC with PRC-barrel domain
MVKFISDIVGSEIILFQEHAKLGKVLDLVFDPDSGKVLGLYCYDPILKKHRVIVPSEIKKYIRSTLLVEGYDSLADPSDMIRLQEALKINAKIVKEKVYTESGQKVGKVTAATINTTSWSLDRLYVGAQLGLKNFGTELIIPAAKIVAIESKKIFVMDDYAKVRRFSTLAAPKPAVE